MSQDPYVTYIGATGVAVAWIGASLGPTFLLIGVSEDRIAHLLVGVVLLGLALFSIRDGVKALKHGARSDFTVYSVIPALLLVAGILLAWMGGNRS
jgi:hypothetical protein